MPAKLKRPERVSVQDRLTWNFKVIPVDDRNSVSCVGAKGHEWELLRLRFDGSFPLISIEST